MSSKLSDKKYVIHIPADIVMKYDTNEKLRKLAERIVSDLMKTIIEDDEYTVFRILRNFHFEDTDKIADMFKKGGKKMVYNHNTYEFELIDSAGKVYYKCPVESAKKYRDLHGCSLETAVYCLYNKEVCFE